jgi:protocatechuate 3,4-dioxygenase beta subunit
LTLAAVITGRVSDEDGDAMGLVKIVALHRPGDEEMEEWDKFSSRRPELRPAAMTQTDDRGMYRIFGLKPGEYYIQAADEYEPMGGMLFGHDWEIRGALGSQYAPAYYPGVTQVSQAEAVSITSGEEAQADFIMRRIKTVEISGHVIGADGRPATDVFLYLEELPAPDYGTFSGIETDAKGNFKIKGVAPGSYLLHAQQRTLDEDSYHASQKIEVGSDNIDSITLALGRGTSLAGRVEVSGAGTLAFDRLFISLSPHEDETGGAWARVKKNGTFQLLDVPDGSFAFSINGLEQGWYLKAVRLGATDVLTKGLEVEKGETVGTVQVVLSKGGAQVEGLVKQDDKPLIGARVRMTPDPETPYNSLRSGSTSTDQSGRFSFPAIAPGQYRIVAKTTGPNGASTVASDPQVINISEHEHKSIELTIAPPQAP